MHADGGHVHGEVSVLYRDNGGLKIHAGRYRQAN